MSDHPNRLDKSDNNTFKGLSTIFIEADAALIALNSANVGIWIMDTESSQFLCSKRTKELFGHTSDDELTFEQVVQSVSSKHRRAVLKSVHHAISNKSSLYIEFPIVDPLKLNKGKWLDITGGFGSAGTGDQFFSGIVMDITEQKNNEMRRSKFIGMVSHELKTPLTALKAYVQLLSNWAKKQKDNFTIGALSKVEKQVKKMLNMINGLLSLSGAEAGKIHLTKQMFSIAELIDEVIEETLFLTSSHQIIRIPCDTLQINADRDKIEQVLVNLLSNAAKYSPEGKVIEIGCKMTKTEIEVSIKDNGLGISPEHISQIFDPHYRIEQIETAKIAGFGIGLYLCSEIINRHNGKIWVDSKVGAGSTFKFTLPF